MYTADDMRKLNKDREIVLAEIGALYRELDKQLHLNGASVRVEFTYDEDALGSYRAETEEESECFRFSLPFVSFSSRAQLDKDDRYDLYRHEYAHYMNHYLEIPKEYQWQPGIHGSAWKYCCSLIGAVPSAFYKAGESRKKQDYDSVIEKKKVDYKTSQLLDIYQRQQKDKLKQKSIERFKIGETIQHPKYGSGVILDLVTDAGPVKLKIEFDEKTGIKLIDQEWLYKTQFK